jgi:16S rRNA (guanine527-N7)-methyltransferase
MSQILRTLSELGLSPDLAPRLQAFADLFAKWNRSINLSAARTPAEIEEHLVDSLHVVPHLAPASRVIDVGSGGGLPVVVAAICAPSIQFVALEPVHKKHAFLRTAARELALANLEAFARRVEDHPSHDYDAATSRATFDLPVWIETGLSLVRPGGRVLGFEAVRRDDLPAGTERHTYSLSGKARAIVVVTRPS